MKTNKEFLIRWHEAGRCDPRVCGYCVPTAVAAACEHDFDTVTNKCARCEMTAPVEA